LPVHNRNRPLASTSPSWNIYILRSSPAKFVGLVEAVDVDAAIEKAIREFEIEPSRQKRLIAVRRGGREME
jgi:hypothetical protein